MHRYDEMSREELLRELEAREGPGDGAQVGLSDSRVFDALGAVVARYGHPTDALDLLPVAVLSLDERATIEEANDLAATLLQVPRDRLSGRRLPEVVRLRDPLAFARHFQECLERSDAVTAVLDIERESGWRSVVAWTRAVNDGGGRRGARCALFDAAGLASERTRRQRLESVDDATREVLERLLAAEDGGEDVLAAIAENARALSAAEAAAVGVFTPGREEFESWVQVGATAEAAPGLGWPPHAGGPHAAEALHGRTVRTVRAAGASRLEVPLDHLGRGLGRLYLADKRGGADFDEEDERTIELLAARAAVALRLLAQRRAAARRREWLEGVIERLPAPVVIADGHGRVRANGVARAMVLLGGTGAERGGTPGAFRARTSAGHDVPWEDGPLLRALRTGEATGVEELVLDAPAGRSVTVLAAAAPVEAGPARRGAVLVLQDVTALKTLARLREKWISVIAHELRQPLGTILVSLGLIGRVCGPRVPDAIERIRSAVTRLNRMVDDLLDKAHIDTRRIRIAVETVDLARLAPEIVARSSHLTLECPVKIEVVGESPLSVAADPGRIDQIVTNLLSNAAKYGTPRGEIRLRLESRVDEIVVSVTNGGRGLTADECGRVFEREYRTASSEASDRPGLGLGLYIAKGLVEAQGGRMWVESEPGRATTFSFTLPRRTGSSPHIPSASPRDAAA